MMNCNEFQRQFQESLDRRENSLDPQMQQHADQCESCRQQRQLWQAIETSLVTTASPTHTLHRSVVALAVAACIAFALVMARASDSVESLSLTSVDPPLIESVSSRPVIRSPLDPSGWWDDIRDRDWVGQTMPTVRVVRDGVAPLGRSIQRAATLLTTASGEQTS